MEKYQWLWDLVAPLIVGFVVGFIDHKMSINETWKSNSLIGLVKNILLNAVKKK
jgi:hypothetical protein